MFCIACGEMTSVMHTQNTLEVPRRALCLGMTRFAEAVVDDEARELKARKPRWAGLPLPPFLGATAQDGERGRVDAATQSETWRAAR